MCLFIFVSDECGHMLWSWYVFLYCKDKPVVFWTMLFIELYVMSLGFQQTYKFVSYSINTCIHHHFHLCINHFKDAVQCHSDKCLLKKRPKNKLKKSDSCLSFYLYIHNACHVSFLKKLFILYLFSVCNFISPIKSTK